MVVFSRKKIYGTMQGVVKLYKVWGCHLELYLGCVARVLLASCRVYLNPQITYLFKDFHKEIILGNLKKVGYLGSR